MIDVRRLTYVDTDTKIHGARGSILQACGCVPMDVKAGLGCAVLCIGTHEAQHCITSVSQCSQPASQPSSQSGVQVYIPLSDVSSDEVL